MMFTCPLATLLSASHQHPPCTNPSLILPYMLAILPAARYFNPTSCHLCPSPLIFSVPQQGLRTLLAKEGQQEVRKQELMENIPLMRHTTNFSPKYIHTKTQLQYEKIKNKPMFKTYGCNINS